MTQTIGNSPYLHSTKDHQMWVCKQRIKLYGKETALDWAKEEVRLFGWDTLMKSPATRDLDFTRKHADNVTFRLEYTQKLARR